MKIAYVYDAVYPWVKGGAEKRIYELARRLVQRGHEVHWYGIGWWWPEEGRKDIERDGIRLHGVCKPVKLYNNDRRSIKEAIYYSLKLYPKLRGENFDIIDCQGFPFFSSFTSKTYSLFGKPILVITLHEVWNQYWYEYLGRMGIFGKLIENLMVNLTDKIICVSSRTKNELHKIKPSEKSVIIPNGIDFKEITEINPSAEKSDVIFAGRLIKEKNTDLLLKSLVQVKQSLPNIKCFIIGDGPEKHNLEILRDNLNLEDNVEFLGFLDDQSLISHIKSSLVFTLPSTREGFGMVVLEANASGLPVVVINHPMNASKDLVKDNINGFIAEFNADSLADKILEGINVKSRLKGSCIKFAREYDWDEIVMDLEDFYLEILNSS